jgi:Sec-independent protein translocase protein TatA
MMLPVTAFISPGGGEFLLIMLALILLFGAKDAPRIFRSIHTTLDKVQRAAASFRYKIMYGDLHQETTDDDPYDVEAIDPDETEECSEFEVQSSELDADSLKLKQENAELEPDNSELET